MTKILMVCLGNICRSPLAEGILKSKVDKNKITVDSAGTANYHTNQLPDKRSITIAKQKGIDISNQRSRQFTINDFDQFDLIFAMDTDNLQEIKKLARNNNDQAKVLLILNELYPNQNKNIPDPYYGVEDGFVKVFDMLDEACNALINRLI